VGDTGVATCGIGIESNSTATTGVYFWDGANDGAVTYSHSARELYLRAGGVNFLTGGSTGNATFAGDGTFSRSAVGGTVGLTIQNSATSGASAARLHLDVSDSSTADPYVWWSTDSTNVYAGIDNDDSDKFKIGNSFSTPFVEFEKTTNNATFAGDVGIGTIPAEPLHIEGDTNGATIRFDRASNNQAYLGIDSGEALYLSIANKTYQQYAIEWNGGNDYHTWSTGGASQTERMRIDSSGNVGIGTSAPAKQLHITKAAKADIGTLTDGATITPDFDANQNFSVTLGGNRTLANPSNIDAGQTGSIFVVQDGTGSRTLSFGSYWKFAGGTAPTLSTAAGAVDRIDYIVYTTTAIHAVATLNVS
jgi:hypothetical protein